MKKKAYFRAELRRQSENDAWSLYLIDRAGTIAKISETFKKANSLIIRLDGVFELEYIAKTNEQLGYYFAEIIPKLTMGLKDIGYSDITEMSADTFARNNWYYEDVVNYNTSEFIKQPKSLSEASKEELSALIDSAIIFIQTELNVNVQTPLEWKNLRKQITKL